MSTRILRFLGLVLLGLAMLGCRPSPAVLAYARGNDYHTQGKLDLAIADCNRAIELDPKYAAAYYERADAYHELQMYDQAIGDYTKAIELNYPRKIGLYVQRGNIYDYQGNVEQAIADFTTAIALGEPKVATDFDPDLADAYIGRGTIYKRQRKLDQALGDVNRALELKPYMSYAYETRGLLLMEMGLNARAIQDFKTFVQCPVDEEDKARIEQLIRELEKAH